MTSVMQRHLRTAAALGALGLAFALQLELADLGGVDGHERLEALLDLLEAGADPNDQRSGFAPLHIMTWVRKPPRGEDFGAPPPTELGKFSSVDFIRALVKRGADVNLRESEYRPVTGDVEIKLGDALGPLSLAGEPIAEQALLDHELVVLPQPGHTPGSLCLLYRGRFLFSGDHLGYSRHLGHPIAPRLQCWEDWERQTRSVRYLATLAAAGHLRFAWILPGHGEWHRLPGEPSAEATATALRQAVSWMERQPPGHVPLPRWVAFAQSRMKPKSPLSRAVRFLGGDGAGSDAWLLPARVRPFLPDYDPARAAAAARRLALLGAAALAVAGIAWLGAGARTRAQRAG